jgi:hypothetical protein
MPNPQTPTSTPGQTTPKDPLIVVDDSRLTQNQADSSGSQSQEIGGDDREDDPNADTVEIGDPVPENERTVRAETGEDEDMPSGANGETVDPDRDPSSERF